MSPSTPNPNPAASGQLRAFVATRVGGYSWVVDLLPDYDLTVGSGAECDVRVELPEMAEKQAILRWTGDALHVTNLGASDRVLINGKPTEGQATFGPGDEVEVGTAALVVNITLAPDNKGRRSLTHAEFCERVTEELARAGRVGRATCLMMLKSKSGDGSRLASAALDSFRAGDIVGTYAHDEIEFLLPDTPPNIARAVVMRMIERAGAEGAHVGMAIAPGDGDTAERLVRAARDGLASAIASDQTIAHTGIADSLEESDEPSPHTEATKRVIAEITAAASSEDGLLLIGEASSGKRHLARLFHDKSARKAGPMVVIQCAALVDRDALTHAFGDEDSVEGCLAETATGGTLLLDEIGDLPLPGQRRLLRLFEEGSEDFNIVATTHRDLTALCSVGAFQQSLHDKIGMRRVEVPALRMRGESIVPLARNFAQQFGDEPIKLSEGAIEKMRAYQWPGNVLELRNAMERAMTLAGGGEILAEHLPGDTTDSGEGRLREHVGSVERDAIIKALADNNYNQTHAARLLGISRRALIYKMEKYGLKPPPSGAKKA